jgi:protein phosphatase
MQISSYGTTHVGKVRTANEDAFFISEAHQLFAVADGLGGLPGGAEASQRIVELLEQTYHQLDANEERADLGELILGINQILTQEGDEIHPFTGYGSTLTIAQLISDQLLIGHIGDSAAFHLRGDDFNQITIDHTMEQEFIERAGEEARASMPPDYSHTLTRCIGQNEDVRVDQSRLTIARGDRLLLCTDGLNKVVTKQQIHATLKTGSTPQTICQSLIDHANAAGGPDNITAIVVFIEQ